MAEKEEAEPISEVIKTESIDALEAEIVGEEEEVVEVPPVIFFDEVEEVTEVIVVEEPTVTAPTEAPIESAPTEEPSNKDLLKVESETLSVALNPDKAVIQAEAEK